MVVVEEEAGGVMIFRTHRPHWDCRAGPSRISNRLGTRTSIDHYSAYVPLTPFQSSNSPTFEETMPYKNESSIQIAAPPAKVREVVCRGVARTEVNKH